jgi:hypothetical protein
MMNLALALGIQRFIAVWSYPPEPNVASYDDLIKSLNRARRSIGLPRVVEFQPSERPFNPQPYFVEPTFSTASTADTYDYEPPDEIDFQEPRGFRP